MSELFKLKNGTVLVSTEAPGGIYNSAQLKKIADLCSKELAIVKATEDQRLALFVKETELDRVVTELKATGLGFRNYQDGVHQPVSCLGELCESHEQPALTTAMDLTKLIAHINLSSPLKIGINGCARCCTPCHTLDISVIGEASGYRVSLGGKTSQFPELASFFAESVPSKDLPRLLATIVELFKTKAEPGESLNEVLDRCGTEDFVAALAPYSQDAAHRDDPFAVSEDLAPEESSESEDLPLESPEDVSDIAEESMEVPSEEVSEELSMEGLPSEEIIPEADLSKDDEDMSFDFSSDEAPSEDLAEVRISEDDHAPLSDDILVNGGEEPAIEDDEDLIFEDEALMSDELINSEPELIEDESVELEADVPEMAEETAEMPELGEELLASNDIEGSVIADTSLLDEGDDGEGAAMDGEAERLFEEKLQASIEEDKKLRAAGDDMNENVSARADALRLLESASDLDAQDEEMTLSDEDEALLGMAGDDEEISEVELEDVEDMDTDDVSELELETARAPAPVAPKTVTSLTPSEDYDFEGFDVLEMTLRVSFGSGAYLDFQLDSVSLGKTRVFRAGEATIRVTHEEDGYSVEGGGMKMYYPLTALKAAS